MQKTRSIQPASLLARLAADECGAVASAELMMLVTVLALGIVVAAKSLRDTAVTEFADFAQAIGNFDQSYNVPDVVIDGELVMGSGFEDARDFCDTTTSTMTSSSNTAAAWASGDAKFTDPLEFGIAPSGE